MANEHHLGLLGTNVDHWSAWRREHRVVMPDLSGARLQGTNLSGFDLSYSNLRGANLRETIAIGVNFEGARCQEADCSSANFRGANFKDVDFTGANLGKTNFYRANLEGTILSSANIFMTVFREAQFGNTILADLDLETAVGLEEIKHLRTSSLSTDTLFRSSGHIPEVFLRKTGVPPELITYLPSLVEASQAVQFHSCFISYSHHDESFARKLWSRMRQEKIRVWYAPEEMQGGKKLFDQIDRAIQLHDKLLVVLSKSSMESDWVVTEIRKARKHESKEGRRKLFPIRLVDFDTIQNWECFDAETGRDIATEVREYFIPDFSKWMRDPRMTDVEAATRIAEANFESAFHRLCRDLRSEGVR